MDDTHLLFTFHANELMRRDEPREDKGAEDHEDQTIRALVLELPSGKVTERASWRVHDRSQWLWRLGHGRFLEREAREFYMMDGTLASRHAYFASPGPPVELDVAPGGEQMMVEWRDEKAKEEPSAGIDHDEPAVPEHHARLLVVDLKSNRAAREASLPHAASMTLTGDGYLHVAPGKMHQWNVFSEHFGGEPDKVTSVVSGCQPELNPIAARVFLASLCLPYTTDHLVQAWDLNGHKLWEQQWGARFVWGSYGLASNGRRFAYESLALDHPVEGTLDPVAVENVQAQVVGVYDVRDGHLRMVTEADPMLTAGQNYALSDDGTHFAVMRKGNIEIYDLPPAPPLQ